MLLYILSTLALAYTSGLLRTRVARYLLFFRSAWRFLISVLTVCCSNRYMVLPIASHVGTDTDASVV